jgi:hypothetical protein
VIFLFARNYIIFLFFGTFQNIYFKDVKIFSGIILNGYKKAARKGRIQKEPLYRESSLINFCNELDLV